MGVGEKIIELSRWDGSGDGWKARLPLRRDWRATAATVDASALTFVVPTFLLRLRAFIDFNVHCGRTVQVIAPRDRGVASYLARTELCGNAVEHGRNDLGCYLAAQRYGGRGRRTVLSIGDLGIGVPKHMRQVYGDASDRRMLRKAIEEGVSGTGEEHRGNGIPSVLEEARNSRMRYALLEIRSGKAILNHRLGRGGSSKTTTAGALNKLGTWICFELGPLD